MVEERADGVAAAEPGAVVDVAAAVAGAARSERTGDGLGAGVGAGNDQFGEHADEVIGDLRAMRRPRLFIVSGPSGVGKDTVIERLRERFPEAHFTVTATTRPRRPGEIDGVHYYFLDEAGFVARLGDDEFLESATVYGNRYGVPRTPIRHALAHGQDVFVKVDVQGAASIRGLLDHTISIFLAPESMAALLQRLLARQTDDYDAVMHRFGTASRELVSAADFDYVIFNESERVERTLDQISAIVGAEHCRTRQPEVRV